MHDTAHSRRLTATLCILSSGLAAQSYLVSPAQFQRYEASAANEGPFANLSRYQQIHGDLKGTARAFTALWFRRDTQITNSAGMVGRNLDFEMQACNASYASFGATFASNYGGTLTTVYSRKTLSTPDFTPTPDSTPAPWLLAVIFDAPYSYAGTADLLWEARVYNSTAGGGYSCDAASARDSSMNGAMSSVGLGCYTANGNMRLRSTFTTNLGTNTLSLTWEVTNATTAAPAGVLVGATNPNLFLPNLCGGNRLYTDVAYFVVSGSTDALGRWTLPTATVAWNPYFIGGTLTAQAAALDFGQGGLNVAASNGITSEVAPGPTTFAMGRLISTNPTATTGVLNLGYGLITRFQF